MVLLQYITQVPARFFTKFNFQPFKFTAVSSEISHCKIFSGMVKTVVIAWVIWFIYIILLETAAPKVIYEPKENITLTSRTDRHPYYRPHSDLPCHPHKQPKDL